MNASAWVLIAACTLLAAWDVYAAVRWGTPATISADLLAAARQRPIIACAVGVLIGHFFWPQS